MRSYFIRLSLLLFLLSPLPLLGQNDKQVLSGPVITPDEIQDGAAITYLIRFKNMTDDTVQHIAIRDTLDPRLDIASVQVVSASHSYLVLREDTEVLKWYFKDIHLPDEKSGGQYANGYIMFTVKPKEIIAAGQTIVNRACIAFMDDVVCTNSAIVWIDENSPTREDWEEHRSFKVVPNPNYGQFEVYRLESPFASKDNNAQWWITDLSGRRVCDGSAFDASNASYQVFLEKPMPGLYLLWVRENARTEVERITIIR